jgi:hypothetical protein
MMVRIDLGHGAFEMVCMFHNDARASAYRIETRALATV